MFILIMPITDSHSYIPLTDFQYHDSLYKDSHNVNKYLIFLVS